MRSALFPLILLGLPLAEIAGFVVVGKWLGVFGTLGLVVLSSLVGIMLLRQQGLSVLKQLNAESRSGRLPGEAIGNGAIIVIGAILLIIPGFISDIAGLLLFIPAFRRFIWQKLGTRVVVRGTYSSHETGAGAQPDRHPSAKVIDLDSDEFKRGPDASSPWSNGPRIEP